MNYILLTFIFLLRIQACELIYFGYVYPVKKTNEPQIFDETHQATL